MRVLILFALFTFALAATTRRAKQTAKAAYEWEGLEDTSSKRQSRTMKKRVAEYWDEAAEGLETLDKWRQSLGGGFKLLRAVYEGPQNVVPPEDYLKACQSSSGQVPSQVKRTLQKTKSAFRSLIQAIRNDEKEHLVDGIRKARKFMPEKVAGFYAGIKALASLERSQRSSGQQESCLKAIRQEFENMHQELHKLMPALKETIDELRQIPGGQNFINIFQNLMQVRVHFDKYLETPSQTQRQNFVQVCESQQITLQTEEVQNALENFKEQLDGQNVQEKDLINVAEAATGLFAQSVSLKASCHEAARVDQSTAAQAQQLKADIQENQTLLGQVQKDVEEILGANRGIFRRLFY